MRFVGYVCIMLVVAALGVPAHAELLVIDSSQSYVSTFVPNWTAYSVVTQPWQNREVSSTPVWSLEWTLTEFQVSGHFWATSDISPYGTAWAHLTLSDQSIQSDLPGGMRQSFSSLPMASLTYSIVDGAVADDGPCSMFDPYYPMPMGGSCSIIGSPGTLSGNFDGQTLDIVGTHGGFPAVVPIGPIFPVGSIEPFVGDPGMPPTLDPSDYPTVWLSYRVVANVVPEPGTLSLVMLGGLWIFSRPARKPISPSDNVC